MATTMFPGEAQEIQEEGHQKEQLYVQGEHLVERVKELVHEGNVRRLIIKQAGHTVVEIPVTWGIIGTLLSPTLAAVAAIGMMVSDCTLEVIRDEQVESPCPQD